MKMVTQILSLVVLAPVAFIMLLGRLVKCITYTSFDLYVSMIPSPKAWYMFGYRIFDPNQCYTVLEDGSMTQTVYCYSCDGCSWSAEEMDDIRHGYGFMFLFVLAVSWYLNHLGTGFLLISILYWFNSIVFMKPGESWG